jgi:para-nitrobenzyl esterase
MSNTGRSGADGGNGFAMGRRTLLKGATLIMGAGAAAPALGAAPDVPGMALPPTTKGNAVVAGANTATVEINSGKVAGFIGRGIFQFKGIPYADTTEGANRFLPPQKPKPWTGIRSSRQYGFVCPQDKGTGRQHDEEAFMFQWNDSVDGEDCLRINVWTPGINDNQKRPVMVWLHGGGFAAGSGNDIPAFDGENLARHGDVVVVTLNHRLNLLGFLDLSKYGEKYAQSGNVGMIDIVAALQWIRDNIAVFGGDPGRVLIFGQSGGGAKVGTLMGMPAAKGLFHRAVVESGSFALSNTQDKSQKLADLLLAELGLNASSVDRLQTVPYAELQRASAAVMRAANPPMGGVIDFRRMASMLNFGPVIDGKVLPEALFQHKAPAVSADVPMIIGTTLNEFAAGFDHPEYERMTDAELEARTETFNPGHGKAIVAAFRARTPGAKPFDLWSRIASAPIRQGAVRQATAKAALNKAPAYLYWFTWQTPILDGRPRAFHCAEIPFVFCNTDRCANMTGGGPEARALSAKVADAWVQFARTGNPNHPGIPNWAPFSPKTVPTMMFDNNVELALDPDGKERKSLPEFKG